MKSRKQTAIFMKFAIPYVILLLITNSVFYFIYNRTAHMIKGEVIKTNHIVLEQAKDSLEQELQYVESTIREISKNPKIVALQYLKNPLSGSHVNYVIEAQNELDKYKSPNNFVLDPLVLYRNSDLALTPRSIYNLDDFYGNALEYENMEAGDWMDWAINYYHYQEYTPENRVKYNDKKYMAITLMQSMGYPRYFKGTVMMLLNSEKVKNMLSKIDLSDGGWAYIADKQGNILTSVTSENAPVFDFHINAHSPEGSVIRNVAGQDMYFTFTVSSKYQWTYVAVQPRSMVLGKVDYIRNTAYSLLGFMLFAGLALSVFLSYRNSKPLSSILRLINELQDTDRGKDVFSIIHDTIHHLNSNNQQLKDEFQQNLPALRSSFFERLAKGEQISLRNTEALMNYMNIEMKGPFYAVILVVILDYQEETFDQAIIAEMELNKKTLRAIIEDPNVYSGYHVAMNDDETALILNLPCETADECKRMIRNTINILMKRLEGIIEQPVFFSVGSMQQSLLKISASYEDALWVKDYMKWNRNLSNIAWYDELPLQKHIYYFPNDIENKLIHLTKSADQAELETLIETIYYENFSKRNLSLSMRQLLIGEISGTFIKITVQLGMELEEFPELEHLLKLNQSKRTVDVTFDLIRNVYRKLCDKVMERNVRRNLELRNQVLGFIMDNYHLPDFCLSLLAEQMNLSEVYLSYFLKEQLSITFSEHVNELRMNKARKLLAETNLGVNEITVQTGYNSSNAFCRAFKRNHGVSPISYRKNYLNEQ